MPSNNVDFNCTFTFLQKGSTAPLYLTTTGETGAPPLNMVMWLRQSPAGPVAAEFSSPILGLSVLPSPNDNQLAWSVPFSIMETFAAGLYYGDIIAIISPSSRLGYGSFLFPVEQGVTTGDEAMSISPGVSVNVTVGPYAMVGGYNGVNNLTGADLRCDLPINPLD